MKTAYRPYLLARIDSGYSPSSTGLNEILSYDYMGSAEFEFGAIPTSIKRMRATVESVGLSIYELQYAPRKGFTQGADRLYALVSPTYVASLENGAQSLTDGLKATDKSGGCKEPPYFNEDFAAWHDIEHDIFFTPNETFAQLIHSVLSRPVDYSKTIDQTLHIGDEIRLATVLAKSVPNVLNMGEQFGNVAGIIGNKVTIKNRKTYRMPYAYILSHKTDVIK